ncbi:MAG: CHASE3 domain-containing protein, partial [Acidobacteriota bacterium]
MNSFEGGRIAVAFTVVVLLLITNAVVSYRSVSTLIANNKRVSHTQDVLEDLQEVNTQIVQAETSARGYFLSGDEVYLAEYYSSVERLRALIADLKEKTADNSSHRQKYPVLEGSIDERVGRLDRRIARRKAQGPSAAFDGREIDEGKRSMDAVRADIARIASDERGLLIARVAESDLSGQRTLLTFAVANGVLLALLCVAGFLAVRDVRERRLNETRLQAERDLLEQRVIERTAELNDANTELQRSNRELQDFAFVASHDLQEPLRKIQ